eukprot:Colp12_sorted_trinity150504_noHs@13050
MLQEHGSPCLVVGQPHQDALLQSPQHSGVEFPREVASSEQEDQVIRLGQPVHLHQQLSLHPHASLVLTPPPAPPDPRELMSDSSSSTKIVEGAWYRASSKSVRTSFSESPLHLLTTEAAEMLKNVVLHSLATALASSVLPVPGGPYKRRPFQGARMPLKSWGYLIG